MIQRRQEIAQNLARARLHREQSRAYQQQFSAQATAIRDLSTRNNSLHICLERACERLEANEGTFQKMHNELKAARRDSEETRLMLKETLRENAELEGHTFSLS